MEKKTSGVEWLVEQLKNGSDTAKSIREYIQQAKEMHEKEIKEAYVQGYKQAMTNQTAQQYYNETYGSTKQD